MTYLLFYMSTKQGAYLRFVSNYILKLKLINDSFLEQSSCLYLYNGDYLT
jgi:hypothetical protein